MRAVVFDYGAGNLHSLIKAIALKPGVVVEVETSVSVALLALLWIPQ